MAYHGHEAATGPWNSYPTSFSSTASSEQDMSSTRGGERAKFACSACRKDNKKVRACFLDLVYSLQALKFIPLL